MKAVFTFKQNGKVYSAKVERGITLFYDGKFSPKKFANEALPYIEHYLKESPMIRRNLGAALSIQILDGKEVIMDSKTERSVILRDTQEEGVQERNRKELRQCLRWLAMEL